VEFALQLALETETEIIFHFLNPLIMRTTGIILIVVGILMFLIPRINFTTEKKVVDVGPIEVNKKENKSIGWPVYAGGIVALLGVGLVIAGSKKTS
jgi:protein-S-isoprenylcysteine O-methyltransferase Ste14